MILFVLLNIPHQFLSQFMHRDMLTLRPAGLLYSLEEPLSGNFMLQVILYTSLQLHG
jgi:hypothetical protein